MTVTRGKLTLITTMWRLWSYLLLLLPPIVIGKISNETMEIRTDMLTQPAKTMCLLNLID